MTENVEDKLENMYLSRSMREMKRCLALGVFGIPRIYYSLDIIYLVLYSVKLKISTFFLLTFKLVIVLAVIKME